VTPGQAAPAPAPVTASGEVKRLRDQLAQLEKSLIDLRTKYTEEHPRVALVKERIAEIQRDLGNAVKDSTVITVSPGAVPPAERVNFGQQVVALETSLHAMSAQEDAARSQVNSLRRNLSGLSRNESTYTRLTAEVENHRNLYGMLSTKLAAARIREQGEMKVVKVIDPPGAAVSTTSQKRIRFLAAALLVAMAVGGGVPVAAEALNKRVESEEDVHATCDLPVLAVIPRMSSPRPVFQAAHDPLMVGGDDAFVFSEAFRTLRVQLQLASRADNVRSVLVTSAYPGEGKSTVVVNLGRAFSEGGVKVVVADTDFLRPTLHHTMKLPATSNLEEALELRRPITDALVQAQDGMWVAAPQKPMKASAQGSLATQRLKTMVEDMGTVGDFVICDSAPVLIAPDSLFLATAVDAVFLVVKVGETTCRDLARAKTALDGVGARVLGVVMNQMPAAALRRHYRRYYAGYYRTSGATK
jgi:capsular exopolysaccharide synthesis family protein